MIRVLIAADHVVARAGIASLLSAAGECSDSDALQIVGETDLAPRALRDALASGDPDVVLVDEPMWTRGLPAPWLRAIADAAPHAGVVCLTTQALGATAEPTELANALHAAISAAAAGYVALPADAMPGMYRRGGDRESAHSRAEPALARADVHLTSREHDVLNAVAEGLANKQIAARLGISSHTVKTHLASVFEKLGVTSRAEAVASGVRQGLVML